MGRQHCSQIVNRKEDLKSIFQLIKDRGKLKNIPPVEPIKNREAPALSKLYDENISKAAIEQNHQNQERERVDSVLNHKKLHKMFVVVIS